ncbi:MAG: hypothetical protein KAI57_04830, partial [Candidatus Pacebacteria bacterium]|nr:hypothetical protein [Candidatus Paceibacterota bacterium]
MEKELSGEEKAVMNKYWNPTEVSSKDKNVLEKLIQLGLAELHDLGSIDLDIGQETGAKTAVLTTAG